MSGHPPRYQPSAPPLSSAPDDEDEKEEKSDVSIFGCIQAFMIVAIFAVAIAVLVLVVQTRGVAQRAFAVAQEASGTVNSQVRRSCVILIKLMFCRSVNSTQIYQE